MRMITMMFGLLFLAGCPQSQQGNHTGSAAANETGSAAADEAPAAAADEAPAAAVGTGPAGRVALVLSDTESDPWAAELLNTLGADLGVDLWSKPSESTYFDLYGPYEIKREDGTLTLDICLCGFSGVSDIAGQEVLGAEARAWVEGLAPDVAWLDGDPAQFQVGSRLDPEIPVVFSGVVIERRLYYDYERNITGVYERFSLPRIMQEIWKQAPDAQRIGLLIDDAAISAGRAQRFISFAKALPEGHEFILPPAASNWDELRESMQSIAGEADAYIFCGVGEPGGGPDFTARPCPPDFMWGLDKPVVILGPSQLDYSGAVSFRLKPSVHARTAFALVERVLAGAPPLTMPSVTPDDMAVFISEVESAQ